MSAQASLSSSTTAPTGAKAAWATPSNLLLLVIIRLLIAWAESLATSLRRRTETATSADLLRAFGTTDTALILERTTNFVQRLRALEAKVLGGATGLDAQPQRESTTAAASAHRPSTPPPRGIAPQRVHLLRTFKRRQRTAAPVRATGPPRPDSARANRNRAGPSSRTEGHGRPRRADSSSPSRHPDRSASRRSAA